jgi:hypothetical protein
MNAVIPPTPNAMPVTPANSHAMLFVAYSKRQGRSVCEK